VINMKIIFTNAEGGLSIIHPTGELPVEDVARKDVPQGVPYKFISEADIPTDRTFRNAWEAEPFEPDGYGDPEGYWADQAAAPEPEPQLELELEEPEA
jgi:hypothetical protein